MNWTIIHYTELGITQYNEFNKTHYKELKKKVTMNLTII